MSVWLYDFFCFIFNIIFIVFSIICITLFLADIAVATTCNPYVRAHLCTCGCVCVCVKFSKSKYFLSYSVMWKKNIHHSTSVYLENFAFAVPICQIFSLICILFVQRTMNKLFQCYYFFFLKKREISKEEQITPKPVHLYFGAVLCSVFSFFYSLAMWQKNERNDIINIR